MKMIVKVTLEYQLQRKERESHKGNIRRKTFEKG